MTTIPLVRASAILPFVQFLDQLGAPTERFLKSVHLPMSILDNLENLAPLYQSFAFAELAARSEGIDNLGLLVGQQTQLSHLGNFGAVVSQALTLHDLIGKMMQLLSTLVTGEKIWLTEEGDYLWLHHQYTVPHHIQTQQAQCFSILVYLNVIRLGATPCWQPDQLHLQGRKNPAFWEVAGLSKTVIHFNQPTNAFRFPKAFLSRPIQPVACSGARGNAEEWLQLTAPATHFTAALSQLIRILLPEGYPSLNVVAEASGTSVRTFQRRLEEANLTYSQVIEEIRFEQAVQLLQDPNNQVIDIAYQLGFTDPANFTRAFKRWTGISPRQFRILHLMENPAYSTLVIG